MTDAISRSAVLGMAYCAIKPTQDCPNVVSVVNVEDIENLPALDVAPVVHARWILEESPFAEHEEAYDGESHNRYVCSRCKCEAGFGCDADGFATDQNLDDWCSSCGARMDGEENAAD